MHFRIGAGTKTTTLMPDESPTAPASIPTPQPRAVMTLPAPRDPSTRMASNLMDEARGIAIASGVAQWTRIHVHVGLGFAHIDAYLPDGQIKRCDGAYERFGQARAALVQHLRSQHRGPFPEFVVASEASDPDDVTVVMLGAPVSATA